MGDQLARRPDLAQVAGQDRREQLVGDFGEVDHWRRGPAKAPPGGGRRHRDGPLILAEAPAERQCGVTAGSGVLPNYLTASAGTPGVAWLGRRNARNLVSYR